MKDSSKCGKDQKYKRDRNYTQNVETIDIRRNKGRRIPKNERRK